MYFVYILESTVNSRWYVGSSDNPERRLHEHNSGKTRSTKPFIPYKIVYIKEYQTKIKALKNELLIKKSGRIRKELKERIHTALSSSG